MSSSTSPSDASDKSPASSGPSSHKLTCPWAELDLLYAAVYDRATLIRARFAFKTIDALHLAAAAEHGCDRFLTNDTRLSRFPDLTVEVLP